MGRGRSFCHRGDLGPQGVTGPSLQSIGTLGAEAVRAAVKKGAFLATALRDGWCDRGGRVPLPQPHGAGYSHPTLEATQAFVSKGHDSF